MNSLRKRTTWTAKKFMPCGNDGRKFHHSSRSLKNMFETKTHYLPRWNCWRGANPLHTPNLAQQPKTHYTYNLCFLEKLSHFKPKPDSVFEGPPRQKSRFLPGDAESADLSRTEFPKAKKKKWPSEEIPSLMVSFKIVFPTEIEEAADFFLFPLRVK